MSAPAPYTLALCRVLHVEDYDNESSYKILKQISESNFDSSSLTLTMLGTLPWVWNLLRMCGVWKFPLLKREKGNSPSLHFMLWNRSSCLKPATSSKLSIHPHPPVCS